MAVDFTGERHPVPAVFLLAKDWSKIFVRDDFIKGGYE